ncbi:TonB-dependent receptor family protein [Chitinophaga filiformis]|uniref:TonB-dependent receptor domain-containing protein n=1 Tax=Chitinophaga filiformis TaxID=104663 RepID=UPI001F3FEA57|nr:TonB-dependent receptor [Chitinophaga filiformis]MCF6407234.1 TonB-dependent receptor family protein [Chitinophaga filiformis]
MATCIYPFALYGQQPSIARQGDLSKCSISGKVINEKTREPVLYASVVVKDSAGKTIVASLTGQNGYFKIDSLPPAKYVLEITYMGYQAYTQSITVTGITAKLELGTLPMKEGTASLNEVVVTGEKSGLELRPDKKVYLIGKDILSQSGSAGDVLNGIPSVAVEPGGAVRLRGNSNVTVLINGRRSGLTPGNVMTQIPAASIAKIEIITSPSARYDAAGSAGIINIVLKKNIKEGLSGQVRAVLGVPNDYNVNANLNYKTGNLNLFATLGGRYSDYVGLYTTKQTTTGITAASLSKVQHENRHDDGRLVYFGADYFINPRNTFTLAFFRNATKDIDGTVLDYDFGTIGIDSSITRNGTSREVRSYNQLESNYTRTFDKEGKKFTIDLQYDFWNSDKTWDLLTRKTFPVVTDLDPIRTTSIGASKDLVIQSDIVNPFKNKSILELGLKAENRSVSGDFKAEQRLDKDWVTFDNIDNKLNYSEGIWSAYAQYRSKSGEFNYLLGLRYEWTQIGIRDRGGIFNKRKYYGRIFPTINLSYAIGKGSTLQMSYAKRINRPELWYLYPFNELTDFNAQFVGNPDLNPSYTNVIELALLRQWDKFTFNPTVYAHFTTAPIEQYTYHNDKGTFITMPFNLDKENRYGVELSAIYDPVKWLTLNGQFGLYGFRQTGYYKETDFDFTNTSWNGRINIRAKLPWRLAVQTRYDLQGPGNNAQRRTRPYHYLSSGLSKNVLRDKGTLTLDGTNVLNSRKIRSVTTGENYIIDQTDNFNAARFRLSFSYKFTRKDGEVFRSRKEGNRD